MIGNDIVDLEFAKTQSNWQRKGFLEKQFTADEQKSILNSEDSFLQVWLFWSMKEAAYKCYVQEYQKRFFGPKKFNCTIISNSKGIVEIESNFYHINYLISNDYIYSIASKKNKIKMVYNLFFIPKKENQTKILTNQILSHFSDDIMIQKNEFGVPFLYQKEMKLPISLSTSHHGNYGGFAFTNT
jgi:phosphopantetheinyl transferase (holo-ACP synthase)